MWSLFAGPRGEIRKGVNHITESWPSTNARNALTANSDSGIASSMWESGANLDASDPEKLGGEVGV